MESDRGAFLALVGEGGEGELPKVVGAAGMRLRMERAVAPFLARLGKDRPEAVLLSFGVPGVDAALAERVAASLDDDAHLLLSAPGASLELALIARRLGTGPLLREPLGPVEIREELERRAPGTGGRSLEPASPEPLGEATGLVGSGPTMAAIVRAIAEVGDSPAPVLVSGESGTGKELVARAIHWASTRRERPFIPINCAAIPEQLLESEFFGHERGAFTGAVARKPGRFERADGGTLFLDEVGEMPLLLQSKLLRALEASEIERVGGEEAISVDVRIVAASNQDLRVRVAEGAFREDLYYRLAVVTIEVPPLRERLDDIEELSVHFIRRFAALYDRPIRGLGDDALRLLRNHDWPGNVRELRNVLDRAVLSSRGGWIRAADLAVGRDAPRISSRDDAGGGYPPTMTLADIERDHIERVLRFTGGVMGEAADLLGIHRNTLTRKVDQYGLRESESKDG